MKYLTLLALSLATQFAYGQAAERRLIYFDYAKADLTPAADSTLGALVAAARLSTIAAITISGHTDADGNGRYNQQLSKARAERIRRYFVAAGVAPGNIKLRHFGEQKPVAANLDADGKQLNRRVEVLISYRPGPVPPGPGPARPPRRSNAGLPVIAPELIQRFTASPNQQINIRGRSGTVITFPANSLVTAEGTPVTADVTIELVEVYAKPDMILALLPTVSDQKPLETGGMIHLKVSAARQELTIKAGESYRLAFQAPFKRKDMEIFYGEAGATGLNWKRAASSWTSELSPSYRENRQALSQYIFDATQLGWINCDRFLNKTPLTTLLVTATDTTNVSFCLVFRSISSVLNVSSRRGGLSFRNVPVGEVAAVIAFRKTSKGVYYASQKVVIQPDQTVALSLAKLTEADFKAQVSSFR